MTVRPDDDNQQELWIFVDHWVPEHGSPAYLSGVVNMQEINIMCLCITSCVCQINHPEYRLYNQILRVSRSELNTAAAASHPVTFSSSFNFLLCCRGLFRDELTTQGSQDLCEPVVQVYVTHVGPTSCSQTRPVSAG